MCCKVEMDAVLAMVLLTVMVKWSMGETNNALTMGDTYAMFGVKKGVHGWRGPRGKRYVVVDQTGAGHYPTVQDAVDSVPRGNRMRVIVFIRPGIYREKVTVPWSKPYITFQGAGRDKTFIEWHNKASDIGADGQQLHTYNTASVTILANHFSAKNITFMNSSPAPLPGVEGYQAVALRASADKAYFLGCGFHGAQDTLCDDLGRHYYTECFIQGSIDFIFGNARSLFYRCELHSVANVFGSIAAQNRRTPFEKTGFSFVQCKVTGKGPLYLGRAMGPYSRIVFAYSYFDDIVSGWDDWDHHTNHQNVFFGVYKCYGPGAREARRISWAQELSPAQAQPFLQETFINGKHWIDHGHP